MCGRYTLKTPIDVLAEHFEVEEYPSSLTPSYNIAPTQDVAAVIEEDEKRKLEMFRWGLIPSWAKDPAIGNRMINARAETVSVWVGGWDADALCSYMRGRLQVPFRPRR